VAIGTAHVWKNRVSPRETASGKKRRLALLRFGRIVRKARKGSGKVACRLSRRQRASYLKVSTTATWTYGWDNLNRMVGVKEVTTTGTQLSVSYSYDVLNNRVEDDTWKASTGTTVTVRHAYDGTNIWADVTTTNTLLARYIYGDGVNQVWARAIPVGFTNSGVAWYLTDREGSVRDIMDSSSVIQDHIDYDGYGNATHTTISFADQFGYAGGLYSYDTKMEQFGARWYDGTTGRWASEISALLPGNQDNPYSYIDNEPTLGTSPTGVVIVPVAIKPTAKDFKMVLKPNPKGDQDADKSSMNFSLLLTITTSLDPEQFEWTQFLSSDTSLWDKTGSPLTKDQILQRYKESMIKGHPSSAPFADMVKDEGFGEGDNWLPLTEATKKPSADNHTRYVPYYFAFNEDKELVKQYFAERQTVTATVQIREKSTKNVIFSEKWWYTWQNFKGKPKAPITSDDDTGIYAYGDKKTLTIPKELDKTGK
jgi:RHS repeat-associated protein